MADLTTKQFEAAKARGETRLSEPRAESALYDSARNCVVIRLTNGAEFAFPPSLAQGLENATPGDLDEIEITPAGLGVHFPKLDADLYVPALLAGVFGSVKWSAGALGRKGGEARSDRKAEAARANGKRGGRPRNDAA